MPAQTLREAYAQRKAEQAREAIIRQPKITQLTPRQAEIFGLIFEHTMDCGFQPSVREIGDRCGIRSPNGAACILRALAKKGWLAHPDGSGHSRAVVFLRKPDGTPFLGFTAK
jgi:SOS-response transcriptional repressor LexA